MTIFPVVERTEERELSLHVLINIILAWLVKVGKFNCSLSVSEAVQEAVKENIWLCHIVITCKYFKEFTQLSNFFAYMQKLDRQTSKKQTKIIYIIHKTIRPLLQLGNALKIQSCVETFVRASHAEWQWWHRIDNAIQILLWQEDIAGGKNCFLFLCSFIK